MRLFKDICHKIHVFSKLSKYTNEATRIKFANSFLKSKFNYGLPLFFGETENVKRIMHRSVMKIGRYVKNSYCYMKSAKYILKSCNWEDVDTQISKASTIFIHKIVSTEKPNSIFKKYRCNRTRTCKNITLNYFPKTSKFQRCIINKGHDLFNKIDPNIRVLPPKEFKKEVNCNNYLKPNS